MNTTTNNESGVFTSGNHTSYWLDSVTRKEYSGRLNQNLKTDVVIVGGGMAGISCAYCLTQAGKNVVLIEDGYIGSGETGRTTAELSSFLGKSYYEIEDILGKDEARLLAQSQLTAIDFIESVVIKEKIKCDFERVNGYFFLNPREKKEVISKEKEALRRVGIDAIEMQTVPGIKANVGKCLCLPNQAQFHPLKYLNSLCEIIEANGGRIFTRTHALEIDSEGIKTNTGFNVSAKHIIIATNSPINSKYIMPLKQDPARTYVIGSLVKKGSVAKSFWWDSGDSSKNEIMSPYHYVRLTSYNEEFDLLLVGGEDHHVGDTSAEGVDEKHRYGLLEVWARKHFTLGDIVYRWSGQVMNSMDSVAYIGKAPMESENIYIVTGDSGNGMTNCTIAGILLTDLITGKDNEWEELYSPSRLTMKESLQLVQKIGSEMAGTVKSWFSDKANPELSSIKKGMGKVVERDGEKYAVYRDGENNLHVVSALCTHLKCTVKWNDDENTWDCPCHGSRFTHEGKVINGPANKNLKYFNNSVLEKNNDDAQDISETIYPFNNY